MIGTKATVRTTKTALKDSQMRRFCSVIPFVIMLTFVFFQSIADRAGCTPSEVKDLADDNEVRGRVFNTVCLLTYLSGVELYSILLGSAVLQHYFDGVPACNCFGW